MKNSIVLAVVLALLNLKPAAAQRRLVQRLHPDWTYRQIKNQILQTVDLVPQLAGKTATGGRLNAARALSDLVVDKKF